MSQAQVPPTFRIHLHCFNGNWDLCQKWLNEYPGLKIGITGLVTYRGKRDLRDVVQRIDLDRYHICLLLSPNLVLETFFFQSSLLIESDAPYMEPNGSQDGFSHPGNTIHIAQCIARLRGTDLATIIKATRKNIKAVYENMEWEFGIHSTIL